jgi:hydrogenase-4 component D
VIGAILVLLIPKAAKGLGIFFSLLAAVCGILLVIAHAVTNGVGMNTDIVTLFGINFYGITIDTLSVLVNLVVVGIGFLICTYSVGYMSDKNREHPIHEGIPRFYAWMLLFISSMAGLVLSSTMLGLLFFFEMTGLCSWGLIAFYGDQKSRKSALLAIVLTHAAAIGLYFATVFLFVKTGSFNITALNQLTEGGKTLAFLAILVACWGKSAQVPFQTWLPEAMVAPTPVSAYLHAASMVKVGVYIFARTVLATSTGVPHSVGVVGAVAALVTMIYGFCMYFPQLDMKRLLAYSTITQLSYIFLAISISIFGSKLAFEGAVVHIFNHAFAKGLFFLVAGGLACTTGTRMLNLLKGILTKLPILGVGFIAAALAITGVPPFSGFFSKFYIFAGGFEIGKANPLVMVLILIMIAESVGSFIWFLKWLGTSVIGEPSEAVAAASPVPGSITFVLVILVIMTLVSPYIALSFFR